MKVHLRTFGCRANHYDTEQVRALVAAMGASESDAAEADVAVLNSCAVTSDAEADLLAALLGFFEVLVWLLAATRGQSAAERASAFARRLSE